MCRTVHSFASCGAGAIAGLVLTPSGTSDWRLFPKTSRVAAARLGAKISVLWCPVHPFVHLGVTHDGLHILAGLGERDGLDELFHVAEVA